MGKDAETHSQTLLERECKWKISIKSLTSDLRDYCGTRSRKIVRAWRALGEQGPLNHLLHRDWSSKPRVFMGLHQVLCLCIIHFCLASLWDFWLWEWMGLWCLCLVLGLFFSWWVAVSNSDLTVFVLFYYILNPNGNGRGETLGGVEGGKTTLRIYYMRKESIINKRRKRIKTKE